MNYMFFECVLRVCESGTIVDDDTRFFVLVEKVDKLSMFMTGA